MTDPKLPPMIEIVPVNRPPKAVLKFSAGELRAAIDEFTPPKTRYEAIVLAAAEAVLVQMGGGSLEIPYRDLKAWE